jgi:hypothetical protein
MKNCSPDCYQKMRDLQKIYKSIEKKANVLFPAVEIWFRRSDCSFYAKHRDMDTFGYCEGEKIYYKKNVENVQKEKLSEEGYVCMGMLL